MPLDHVVLADPDTTPKGTAANPLRTDTAIGIANSAVGILTITNSAVETTILAVPGAGKHYEIESILVSNLNAAAVTLTLRDGSGGAIKLNMRLFNGVFGTAIPIAFSSNTLVTVQCTPARVSDIFINLYGRKVSD